jgi:segregation and condensation protein A
MPSAAAEPDEAGQGGAPRLSLGTFDGPLDLLLGLARAQAIDLARLSLPDLLDQLGLALDDAAPRTSLGEKAGWMVMASWLVLLRSRLLLPDTAVQRAADDDARQLRDRLLDLQAAQGLAAWLDRRAQLGQDVFPRGQPEFIGTALGARHEVDVVEFLWAGLALFDDGTDQAELTAVYTPPWHGLHSVREAQDRILRRLATTADAVPLGALLPPPPADSDAPSRTALRRRSAWSSTFLASLELTRQGVIGLQQNEGFGDIHLQIIAAAHEPQLSPPPS